MERKIPKQIAIEITTRCQLRCKGCMKTIGYPDMDMSFDFYKSVVDRNTFGATIIPYQNGEPLLHPDIFKMTEYTLSKDQRMYITTNGMIWNEDLFQLITEKNRCFQIIFSLDGLPGEKSKSIESARPGSSRQRIIDNVMSFMELKERKGNNIDLCLKMCRRGQDFQEVEEFIYHWLKVGIDYICIGQMLNQQSDGMRMYPCQYFSDMYMLIRADRKLIPCMYNYEVAVGDYFDIGELDETEDLIDAYNRVKLIAMRENQENGIFSGPCAYCGSAYTGFGYRGEMTFNREDRLDIGTIYTGVDYYNQMFSLKDKRIGIQHGRIE